MITVIIISFINDGHSQEYKLKKWAYLTNSSIKGFSDSYLKTKLININAISITGVRLKKDGNLQIHTSPDYDRVISIAKTYSVSIFPHVSFSSVKNGRIMLTSESARNRAVINLKKFADNRVFFGINLDFEYLAPKYVHKLAVFLRDLNENLNNFRVTMAIFPQIDFPKKWAGFHDLNIISPFLDEIVIMCYDYHNPKTLPGPVTDLKWSERNIVHCLKFFKPNRIWLGVPAYGYIWINGKKTRVISARYANKKKNNIKMERHSSGTVYYEYYKKGKKYSAYFADLKTREKLENLAKKYKLKGVALWRLGFEEEDYWK